jgi:hypothetical protein
LCGELSVADSILEQMRTPKVPPIIERDCRLPRKIVGSFAVLFGALGILIAIASLSDRDDHGRFTFLQKHFDPAPAIIALVAHAYLTIAGVRLVKSHPVRLLPHFFSVEAAYTMGLFAVLPLLVSSGLINPSEMRWTIDVSAGFLAQALVGFPLWGWLLSRGKDIAGQAGSEGHP